MRASNLDGNKALKTDAIGQLFSTNLEISDVNTLQQELDSALQNPFQDKLVTDGLQITAGHGLETNSIEKTSGTFIQVKSDLRLDPEISLRTDYIAEGTEGGGVTISDELKCTGDISTSTISSINTAVKTLNTKTQYVSVD